jgi:preprotein translocase subunit SecE
MFAVGGVVLAWLLAKSGEWAWSYFGKPNGFAIGTGAFLVAGLVTLMLWRNEEIFQLASEVTGELKKVTWPSRKELVSSTIVVIVTSIIASLILGVFDGVWAWVTRQIYG